MLASVSRLSAPLQHTSSSSSSSSHTTNKQGHGHKRQGQDRRASTPFLTNDLHVEKEGGNNSKGFSSLSVVNAAVEVEGVSGCIGDMDIDKTDETLTLIPTLTPSDHPLGSNAAPSDMGEIKDIKKKEVFIPTSSSSLFSKGEICGGPSRIGDKGLNATGFVPDLGLGLGHVGLKSPSDKEKELGMDSSNSSSNYDSSDHGDCNDINNDNHVFHYFPKTIYVYICIHIKMYTNMYI